MRKLFTTTLLSFGQVEKFNADQFGFNKGKSCLSQLLHVYHDWASEEIKGKQSMFKFMDLSKAFDIVPHNRLLMKIRAYGINGPLLSWLRSFLKDRFQRVIVRGTCSSWVSVKSGVSQGTVLGPIMLLIYINDISHGLSSPVKLFADDMKIYRVLNTEKDTGQLQGDLFKFQSWSVD